MNEARDKALQEIIDFCSNWAIELCNDTESDYYANFMQADALDRVICHCRSMLGSGSMPSEASDQSEDTKE